MKKIIVLAIVVACMAGCKGKGWTSAQKTDFITTCTNAAKEGMGDAKAKSYCDCMQPKLEAKYPSYDAANHISDNDMKSADWQATIQECLK